MKPQMTPYLSDKMKVLSLIAITTVIYIHTYYTEGEGYSSVPIVFVSVTIYIGSLLRKYILNAFSLYVGGR